MAPVVLSDTPPSSPSSPPRKKAKFSLRLKGKSKPNKEDEKPRNVSPSLSFFSPSQGNHDTNQDQSFDLTHGPEIPPIPHAGLVNHGNICYSNAVLQVLRVCPGFEDFVGDLAKKIKTSNGNETNIHNTKGERERLTCQLDELLCQMKTFENDFLLNKDTCSHLANKGNKLILATEPFGFMEAFREHFPAFESNLQHDAQEFLCSLIMVLQESQNKQFDNNNNCSSLTKDVVNKEPRHSYIENLFQGTLVHQTKCLNCEEPKLRYEDFQDVSVPVIEDQAYLDARKKLMLSPTPKKSQDNAHSLQWAVSQFASSECLQGQNKYFCDNCNTYCEAEIKTCFDKLPIVLTVHLKRFTSSVGLSSKITSNLKTPLILSVKEWCSKKCQLESNVYELFGIVVHSGMTSGSGHYETYVRIPNDSSNTHKHADNDQLPCIDHQQNHSIPNGPQTHSEECTSNTCDACTSIDNDNKNTVSSGSPCEKETIGYYVVKSEGPTASPQCKHETKYKTCHIDTGRNTKVPKIKTKRKTQMKLTGHASRNDKEEVDDSGGKSDENTSETVHSSAEAHVQGHVTCMSVITKYFHRMKKPSTTACNERVEHCIDTESGPINNECGKSRNVDLGPTNNPVVETAIPDQLVSESSNRSKLTHQKPLCDLDNSQRTNSPLQHVQVDSKSQTIRRLNFHDSNEKAVCNGDTAVGGECCPDDQVPGSAMEHIDTLKKGWIHYDDCMVFPLEECDLMTALSAASSSFHSPYLLFYQKSNICQTAFPDTVT